MKLTERKLRRMIREEQRKAIEPFEYICDWLVEYAHNAWLVNRSDFIFDKFGDLDLKELEKLAKETFPAIENSVIRKAVKEAAKILQGIDFEQSQEFF